MIIEKILENLQKGVESSLDLLEIMTSIYPEAYRKARQRLAGRKGFYFKTNWAAKYKEIQRFYNLLSYLKRQGFIENYKKGRESFWEITDLGKEKLETLKNKKSHRIVFEKIASDKLMVIAFDIPEQFRKHRDWLRNILKFLDFSMIQKSVWVGKNKIPREFIKTLREKKMINYIEIFEVNKEGTLKKLKV
ncbi:MAG: hypothetical protein HYV52_02825 [Parcubacteria group bacterium]|nr:hypothetical protein [Parcubacteria group bacterium]